MKRGEPEKAKIITDSPRLSPWAARYWVGFGELATPPGFSGPGRIPYREKVCWLDENGVSGSHREVYLRIWSRLEGVLAEWMEERREEMEHEHPPRR